MKSKQLHVLLNLIYLIHLSFAGPIRIYMFDKCKQTQEVWNGDTFQLRILGKNFTDGRLSCSVTFKKSEDASDFAYYKITNYTVWSADVRLSINDNGGNVIHGDFFNSTSLPRLNHQLEYQKALNVYISRRNIRITSTFIIYIQVYAKVNTETQASLWETIGGYTIFIIVGLVFVGFGYKQMSQHRSFPRCPDCSRVTRNLSRLGLNNSRAPQSTTAHSGTGNTPTSRSSNPPAVEVADDVPDDNMSVFDTSIERSSTRSLSETMSFFDLVNQPDNSSNIGDRQTPIYGAADESSVQPSALPLDYGRTGNPGWNYSPRGSNINSQAGNNPPPSYEECVTPPPPSYHEAVYGKYD